MISDIVVIIFSRFKDDWMFWMATVSSPHLIKATTLSSKIYSVFPFKYLTKIIFKNGIILPSHLELILFLKQIQFPYRSQVNSVIWIRYSQFGSEVVCSIEDCVRFLLSIFYDSAWFPFVYKDGLNLFIKNKFENLHR